MELECFAIEASDKLQISFREDSKKNDMIR